MIVDRLEARDVDGLLERSARLRWNGGEFRMRFAVPPELASRELDASPFMSATLLLAMAFHEDLEVDGPVSPLLFRHADSIQRIYHAWDTGLRRAAVRVAEERAPEPTGDRLGSFFSRGIDSLFTALHPRPSGNPELLVFCSTFDPFEDERARFEQLQRARAAAEAMDMPLAEVRMNVRELTERIVDFADLHGAVLGALAQCLSGGLRTVVIPSSHAATEFNAWGSSPLLDPLFGTEATNVEHDSVAFSRLDKIAWLAHEQRAVLAFGEVCQARHALGNCGRCDKCLLTAAGLVASGAPGAIPGLPARPDPATIRSQPLRGMGRRLQLLTLHAALREQPDHAELARAIAAALRTSTRPGPGAWLLAMREWQRGTRARPNPVYPLQGSVFSARWTTALIELLRYGRSPSTWHALEPPGLAEPWEAPNGERTGLLRGLDLTARRHVYSVGAAPRGHLVGELGALERAERPGTRPLWVTADRRVSLSSDAPPSPEPGLAVRLRWAVAPLGWRESGGRMRAGALAGRLVELVRRRPMPLATSPGFEPLTPAGWIHAEPGAGRVPLYAAMQAATGDQLLTRDPGEAQDMGFGHAELLGYLTSEAPTTGNLAMRRLDVPWASRLGRRARPN